MWWNLETSQDGIRYKTSSPPATLQTWQKIRDDGIARFGVPQEVLEQTYISYVWQLVQGKYNIHSAPRLVQTSVQRAWIHRLAPGTAKKTRHSTLGVLNAGPHTMNSALATRKNVFQGRDIRIFAGKAFRFFFCQSFSRSSTGIELAASVELGALM